MFLMATSSLAQAQSSGLRHLAKFAAKTALSDDIEEAWPRIFGACIRYSLRPAFFHQALNDTPTDEDQLPVTLSRQLPAPHEHGDFLIATDKRREMTLSGAASATAGSYKLEQRYRLWHAF